MKKTTKILFTVILAVTVLTAFSLITFAADECSHVSVGDATCKGHICELCDEYFGVPNSDAHTYAEPINALDTEGEEAQETCIHCGELKEMPPILLGPNGEETNALMHFVHWFVDLVCTMIETCFRTMLVG